MNINILYKKVLIIGETFSDQSGGPITLTNLFAGWPKEKLFVATFHREIINSNFTKCENYYSLGMEERKIKFPLSLIKKKYKSGRLKYNDNTNITSENIKGKLNKKASIVILKTYITNYFEKVLFFLGIYFASIKLTPSDRFKRWLEEIKPDIIYCQFPSLEIITFINDILILYEFKLVIHVMDDQPMTLNKSVLFKKYWDKVVAENIKLLICKANLLLSISDGMSKEYLNRYGKEFIPFHNPIDLQKWLPFTKENWKIGNKFSILYAGRIGIAINESLEKICEVVDEINKDDNRVHFDIFSPDYNGKSAISLGKYSGVTLNKPVSYVNVPKNVSSYDLLVLPYDFDINSIRFARLSMPTKASEYMITGCPILIFASEETEIVRHAKEYGWAYCVTKNDEKLLKSAILKFYKDINLRKMYGKTAHEYALNNCDAEKIRSKFEDLICNL